MKTFTDAAGRLWTVSVTVAGAKRVRDLLGVDLLSIVEGDLLERLCRDIVLAVDVIYVLVKPVADNMNVSDEQFGGALVGDSIEHATNALLEALVDFFPSSKGRLLRRAWERAQAEATKLKNQIDQALDAGDVDRAIDRAFGRDPPPANTGN